MDSRSLQSPRVLRTSATIIYLAIIVFVHWRWIGDGFDLEFKILWLVNGAAALLFGSRILNPHFTPVGVAASNAFFSGAALTLALAAPSITQIDSLLLGASALVAAGIFFASLVALISRSGNELEQSNWLLGLEAGVRWAGSPLTIFTCVILILAWVFHRSDAIEIFLILAIWTTIVALNPIEFVWSWCEKFLSSGNVAHTEVIGKIVAYQNPGLVLIRQEDDSRMKLGTLMTLSDEHGPTTLGVALNYVGRDEGILLRALSLPMPKGLMEKASLLIIGHATASALNLDETEQAEVSVLNWIDKFCGICRC